MNHNNSYSNPNPNTTSQETASTRQTPPRDATSQETTCQQDRHSTAGSTARSTCGPSVLSSPDSTISSAQVEGKEGGGQDTTSEAHLRARLAAAPARRSPRSPGLVAAPRRPRPSLRTHRSHQSQGRAHLGSCCARPPLAASPFPRPVAWRPCCPACPPSWETASPPALKPGPLPPISSRGAPPHQASCGSPGPRSSQVASERDARAGRAPGRPRDADPRPQSSSTAIDNGFLPSNGND